MALRLVADVGMAVGPVLPYAPQYLLLRRTRADRPEDESAMGFSPMVSFVLLMASLSRIFFWLLSRFNVVLLVQAVLMGESSEASAAGSACECFSHLRWVLLPYSYCAACHSARAREDP